MDEPEMSEWARYQIRFREFSFAPNFTGGVWFGLALLSLIMAVTSLVYAELQWQTLGTGSVGIGTSGYALVLFSRPIALGAISAAFATIGILKKQPREFDLRYRTISDEGTAKAPPG